jgi:hypothetical protein
LLKLGKERMTMNHESPEHPHRMQLQIRRPERLNHAPDFMKGVIVKAVQTAVPGSPAAYGVSGRHPQKPLALLA